MAVTHATATRTAIATAVLGAIDAGSNAKLVFRTTGTVAAPGTAVATLTCADPSGTVSNGVLTFSAITADTNAAGGTVATATLQTSADTVCVHCAVSTSASDINLSSLAVGAGDTVSVSSLTYTAPA
jgi:hypothetical protein